MKVLLLADGRAIHTERYKTALEKRGIGVVLASLEPGDIVDILLSTPTGIRGIDYRLAAWKIKSIIESEKPDIVDAHSASGYGYTAAIAGLDEICPLAVHCLGSDILISAKKSAFHRKRIRRALSDAAVVFVDSIYLGNIAARIYPETDFKVICWGAEDRFFKQYDPTIGKMKYPPELPVRALVPRPHENVYNNRYIIASLKDHINNGQVVLCFPDWGSDYENFTGFVNRECPSGGVEFYSRMPREKYMEFIGRFDLYISASRSDSSPASLIEAMAAGLIPMVSDIPGVTELMENSRQLLFNLNDPTALENVFDNLLRDNIDISSVRCLNHELARKVGYFEENIDDTVRIMQSIINHGG